MSPLGDDAVGLMARQPLLEVPETASEGALTLVETGAGHLDLGSQRPDVPIPFVERSALRAFFSASSSSAMPFTFTASAPRLAA